jgi:hypothetical protein
MRRIEILLTKSIFLAIMSCYLHFLPLYVLVAFQTKGRDCDLGQFICVRHTQRVRDKLESHRVEE